MVRTIKKAGRISKLADAAKKKLKDELEMRSRRTTPAPAKGKAIVDVKWFNARRLELGIEQQDIAAAIGRSKSMISRILNGQRTLDAHDVAGLAAILKTSPDEILRRLGIAVSAPGVRVTGTVLADGRISNVSAKVGSEIPMVGVPANSEAVVAASDGPTIATFAGAAFVFVRSGADNPVPPDTFGKLCVIEAEGQVVPVLATMVKTPERGKMTLEVFQTGEKITTPRILRASAVIQILFP